MRKLLLAGSLMIIVLLIGTSTYLAWAGGPVLDRPHINGPNPRPGISTTYAAVANMHASANASVTVRYFSMDNVDEQISQQTTIDPSGRSYTFTLPSTLYTDWQGLVHVEASDRPLATVSQIEWNDGSPGDGTTAAAFNGVGAASTELYFPFVVYVPGRQFTRLMIMNLGAQDTALRFEYFQSDGTLSASQDTSTLVGYPTPVATAISPTPVATPEGNIHLLRHDEAKVFTLRIPGTMVPDLVPDNNGQWGGSVKVTVLNNQPIAGVATNHWRDKGALAYNALSAGTATSYVPSVERRDENNNGLMEGYTVIRIQCIASDGDGDCDVQVSFSGQATPLTCTVVQNAAIGINTKQQLPGSNCSGTDLPSLWVGSARIATTDGSQVGVVAFTIREESARAMGAAAASTTSASTTVYAPDVYKHGTCGGSWVQWSIISVQNVGDTTATNVTLHFLGRQLSGGGHLADQTVTIGSIAPDGVQRYNTKAKCNDLTSLGDDWRGSVRIISSQPVAVVVETLWPDKMSAYNAVPYP